MVVRSPRKDTGWFSWERIEIEDWYGMEGLEGDNSWYRGFMSRNCRHSEGDFLERRDLLASKALSLSLNFSAYVASMKQLAYRHKCF